MGLLDRPPYSVTVYAAAEEVDPDTGLTKRLPGDPTGPGEALGAWVQRPVTTEANASGKATRVDRVLYCRRFPGMARSVVLWDGRLWDVPEEPAREAMAGSHMEHDVVALVARTPGSLLA